MNVSVVIVASVLCGAAASAYAQGVSDAQIASIVVTANQVDIDAGTLAASRSANADVKKFAQLMVTPARGSHRQSWRFGRVGQ